MSKAARVQQAMVIAASGGDGGGYVGNKCHGCQFKRSIPGDCHIECVNPDPDMTGATHGIQNGWFLYPINYDPTWMTKKCCNYAPRLSIVDTQGTQGLPREAANDPVYVA